MKQQLTSYIQELKLTEPDAALWHNFIEFLNEETARAVYQTLQNNDIQFFTKLLRDKMGAIKRADPNQWDNIIQEEQQYLNSLPS